MSLKYKVLPCSNPAGDEGTDYACDRAVNTQVTSFENIADDIVRSSSYSKADVVGVLTAMKEYVRQHLLDGQHVRIVGLGIISPRIKCRCFPQSAISRADFDPNSYIVGAGIGFRPDAELKKYMRSNVKYERVPSDLME